MVLLPAFVLPREDLVNHFSEAEGSELQTEDSSSTLYHRHRIRLLQVPKCTCTAHPN